MAEEEEVEVEGTPGLTGRSRLAIHEGQVQWVLEEYGTDLNELNASEIISVAYATRNLWRQTEAYESIKEEEAERREAEKAERAKAREERAKAKAEAEAAEGGKKKASKKASKKAPAKKARKRSRGKAAKEESEEDPFE